MDVGHTARAKADPVEAMHKCKARLYDCHFKDINHLDAKNPAIAELEVGRGVLDIRGMLAALIEIQYAGHVGFEHEDGGKSAAGIGRIDGIYQGRGFVLWGVKVSSGSLSLLGRGLG